MTAPNFDCIHPLLASQAWEFWEDGDASGIMMLVGHQQKGELLLANIRPFLNRGIYEAALFESYIHGPHYLPAHWRHLFSFADRARLQAQGDPLPASPITVYRGVSDRKHRSWIKGMSWTTNPHTAAWFAMRFTSPEKTPAVYSIVAKPGDILLMTNNRNEEEVILAVWQCGRAKRLEAMPESVKPDCEDPEEEDT